MMPGRPPGYLGRWGENVSTLVSRSTLTGPGVSVMPGGSSVVQPQTPLKQFFLNKKPPFYVYPSDDAEITCTTGNLFIRQNWISQFGVEGDNVVTGVTDGDWIWLEFAFVVDDWPGLVLKKGSDLPTGKFFFVLARVTLTSGKISNIERIWNGGDITLSAAFPVSLESAGGGNYDVYMSYGYSNSGALRILIGEDIAPPFSDTAAYEMQGAGTVGLAKWVAKAQDEDADPSLMLLCTDDYIKTKTVTVKDGSGNNIDITVFDYSGA